MLRPDVKTPTRLAGQAGAEAGEVGNLRRNDAKHGRGFHAYEQAKGSLPPMTPADYTARCRAIADAAGV